MRRHRTGGTRWRTGTAALACALLLGAAAADARAQQPRTGGTTAAAATPLGVVPPPEYVIGPDDKLMVSFWRDKDMSAEVVVRPDGLISLPLLNDIRAEGLTPEQLRERITAEARRFVAEPNATIVVTEINSRKVFITGQVTKPGAYPLKGATTVLQLISMAGGITEYADGKNIVVVRHERGREIAHRFNYRDVTRRRNLAQNIELRPGDTVVVP